MRKLVRDKIPDLMAQDGEAFTIERFSGLPLINALKLKLLEEAQEVLEAETSHQMIEELGDVLDVIDALCRECSITHHDLGLARLAKTKAKGGFKLGLVVTRE